MDSPEYCEINPNINLDYINRILMEDDSDEKGIIYQGHDAMQATEKSFYDILGRAYPSSPNEILVSSDSQVGCPHDNSNNYPDWAYSNFTSDLHEPKGMHLITTDWASELDHLSLQVSRGVEEANKFVPTIGPLLVDLDSDGILVSKQAADRTVGQKSKNPNKKKAHTCSELLEARKSKHAAISVNKIIRDEMFDSILLCNGNVDVEHLRKMMAKESSSQNVQRKRFGQGHEKPRGKTQQEAIDLRALLIQCAQALSSCNSPFASELLKTIRHHSSPYGDGSQRLAVYFADSLEARLAGIGSQMYEKLMGKRNSTIDMIKAYRLYTAACPFKKVACCLSNKTIINVLHGRPKVHIIDFGIAFGFQWPLLFQRLAEQKGRPQKLRITGIDVPQPGFRPCKVIEETGMRLDEYAKMFNIPFQYQGIATRWENTDIEDLKIDKDEVVIINCLSGMEKLGDETEDIDSARDRVLRIMKRIRPEVLILGVVDGLYSSPFFLPRFREVLFHYSSLFDILNATVTPNHEERILIEKYLLGPAVLNVVACEGAERIERPESYKQWQVRSLKAGFKQLPINDEILQRSIDQRKKLYHDEFVIDEDNGWLLQGWKGRTIYALSSWKP